MRKMLIAAAASACSLAALFAKEVVWTGGGSGGWSDPDNWSEAPEADDVAVLPANTLVPVAAADRAAFLAFGGYRLEPGSTLFLDAVTFESTSAFSKPLSGSGALVAVGGSMYLTADNSDFDGTFAFTNNYCDVHHPHALGTTNDVWVKAGRQTGHGIKIDRVDGPSVMSNRLFVAGANERRTVFQAIKSPIELRGLVTIVEGWCLFINDASTPAYYTRFLGGICGNGWLFTGGQLGNVTEIRCGVDLGGGLVACEDGFQVHDRLLRGDIDLDISGKGFVFHGKGLCCTNDVRVSDPLGLRKTGGLLDLNGFSQTIGNVCERLDHNGLATETNFVITSKAPATLTMVGTPNRRYDKNGFAGCLAGAVSLCYDWAGRGGGVRRHTTPTAPPASSAWSATTPRRPAGYTVAAAPSGSNPQRRCRT